MTTNDLSLEEFMRRFDKLWKKDNPNDYKEMYDLCLSKLPSMNKNVIGRLARMYREGKGVTRNLNEAARLMKIAYDDGLSWAFNEYVDLLIKLNSPQSLIEAFILCKAESEKDNAFALNRLSRLYSQGKGTDKNLDKAIECMYKAVQSNPGWRSEYVDLLLSTDTPVNWINAYEYTSNYAKNGEAKMYERLSNMALIGKGTKKDPDMAISMMGNAAKISSSYLGRYIDLLTNSEKEEHRKKAFEICTDPEYSKNAGVIGRLARLYRDGIGVNANIRKAKELMQYAAEQGNVWAATELEQMNRSG